MTNVIQFKKSTTAKQVSESTVTYNGEQVLIEYENLFLLRLFYLYIKPEPAKFLEVTNIIIENLEGGEIFPQVTQEIYDNYRNKVLPNYLQLKEVERENWDAI